jgi:hypothetical protein
VAVAKKNAKMALKTLTNTKNYLNKTPKTAKTLKNTQNGTKTPQFFQKKTGHILRSFHFQRATRRHLSLHIYCHRRHCHCHSGSGSVRAGGGTGVHGCGGGGCSGWGHCGCNLGHFGALLSGFWPFLASVFFGKMVFFIVNG